MNLNPNWPTAQSIEKAHERIRPYIHRTPVLTSESIDKRVGASLYFKCENFQKVGAFKMRGAANAVFSLSEEDLMKGVATHSSGNHAQAVAKAAKSRGAKAYIVMPENAPEVKIAAVKGYGAEITFCSANLLSRETTLQAIVDKTGATFIHPYNDFKVIEGQATCCKELLEEVPDLDLLVVPIGGGGLMSGTCLSAHYWQPQIQIIGAEPLGADDAFRSLQKGEIVPMEKPSTIADGLLTSLGDKTFPILKEFLQEIVTVSDQEIVEAMRLIWERMKIIIEPSCATPLAVVLKSREKLAGKRIGLILTGGNIDLKKIPF